MKTIVSVCGSDGDDEDLSSYALQTAESIGKLLAEKQIVVVCGGRGGIMEAVCKGAKKAQGLTIGLLPHSKDEANQFVDIAIPTELGSKRNFLVVSSGDVVIALAGRVGTLNEITFALIFQKPLILIRGTGGCVDDIIAGAVSLKMENAFFVVDSAEAAVDKVFEVLDNKKAS